MALLRRVIKRSHGHIAALSRCIAPPACSISSVGNEAGKGGSSSFTTRRFPLGDAFFSFSSQSRKKTAEDSDDLEEGFSDLEAPLGRIKGDKSESEESAEDPESAAELSSSESGDDSEETEVEEGLGLSDNEDEKNATAPSPKKTSLSPLFKVIVAATPQTVDSALDEFVSEGNPLGRSEIYSALLALRRRHLYGKALQLFEWLDAKKRLSFVERDYASRLDLVAKALGLYRAEKFLEKIPQDSRGELVYRTLLANCVAVRRADKAEQVFKKMKALGLPTTAFVCNQLLLLYKRVDRKKIADVLLMMEKEAVKPTLITYRVLIDAKGRARDIPGMEKVMENMKNQSLEPDSPMKALIARHYISAGLTDKAEEMLKDMEGGGAAVEDWRACKPLILLYADLGKEAEVERIWKHCEPSPTMDQCLAAIVAYGKLGRVEEAEAVFERMRRQYKKPATRYYNSLLRVYARHEMVAKGKELVKRMGEDGCPVGPPTWDALVGLYVQAGEVEKADELLHKVAGAGGQGKARPLHSSLMAVMEKYAERGDVHNTEKMFYKMRQSGYTMRVMHFHVLLQAYVNAKAPAYGIRERMKADNVFPRKSFSAKLAAADAFRKTQITQLLE